MIPSIPLAFAHAPAEAPGAPPFVVAHGLYGSARNWGSLARAFARKRETIAVDLRGHGESPGPIRSLMRPWPRIWAP